MKYFNTTFRLNVKSRHFEAGTMETLAHQGSPTNALIDLGYKYSIVFSEEITDQQYVRLRKQRQGSGDLFMFDHSFVGEENV